MQVMPKRQAAETLPIRILSDVFSDHHFAPESCRAAGAFRWTDRHSMNRLTVFGRQAGRCAAEQVLTLGVSEENGTERIGA